MFPLVFTEMWAEGSDWRPQPTKQRQSELENVTPQFMFLILTTSVFNLRRHIRRREPPAGLLAARGERGGKAARPPLARVRGGAGRRGSAGARAASNAVSAT